MKKQERSEMDKLVESMMEHVCDHLCRFPREQINQEQLEEICAECQMGEYVCGIQNAYNRINDFEKSQCAHLLKELAAERKKHEKLVD